MSFEDDKEHLKATEVLQNLYDLKTSKPYLKKIKCEECGEEERPFPDGRCRTCGALNGKKPKELLPEHKDNNYNTSSMVGLDTSRFYGDLGSDMTYF